MAGVKTWLFEIPTKLLIHLVQMDANTIKDKTRSQSYEPTLEITRIIWVITCSNLLIF